MSQYFIEEFACAGCGNCCRGEGYVRVTPEELARIAGHLKLEMPGLELPDFLDQYTRKPEIPAHADTGDLWLIDQPGPEQECVFLENNRCKIHSVKPAQCIGFPTKWRTPDIMDYCVGMQ